MRTIYWRHRRRYGTRGIASELTELGQPRSARRGDPCRDLFERLLQLELRDARAAVDQRRLDKAIPHERSRRRRKRGPNAIE